MTATAERGAIGAEQPLGVGNEGSAAGRTRWPFWPALAVLVVGLVATGVLTWVSAAQYNRNEKRLLDLRARDVGAVLTTALPSIQTPLASATALADATGGSVPRFKQFMAAYVGPGKDFVSASLWRSDAPQRGPVTTLGLAPALAASPGRVATFFKAASASSTLNVIGLLRRPPLRLGYAFTGMSTGPFVAYGEGALPPDRYMPVQNNSAFNDVNYALYLGRTADPASLLIKSVHHLPLSGRQTTVRVPFGNTSFAVKVSARGSLEGSLPQRLPWVIAIVGTILALIAAALTARLSMRRRDSERLAEENRRLYSEQWGIAQTLQHSLLPERLPKPEGLEVSARYAAGAEGVDIGGDWYDLIELEPGRVLLVVGDVSGRGLRAATTMASLRFAIKAYAAQGDTPEVLLAKLSDLISVRVDGQLATVLCALVDVGSRRVSVTNAGHLPPLLMAGGHGEFIETPVGLPVGIEQNPAYSSNTVTVPEGATLLAFTDGLVERRGESIEVGLERLRSLATANHAPLDELLTRLLERLSNHASDDTAIAGIRWMN